MTLVNRNSTKLKSIRQQMKDFSCWILKLFIFCFLFCFIVFLIVNVWFVMEIYENSLFLFDCSDERGREKEIHKRIEELKQKCREVFNNVVLPKPHCAASLRIDTYDKICSGILYPAAYSEDLLIREAASRILNAIKNHQGKETWMRLASALIG